jgi:hypothetical protein
VQPRNPVLRERLIAMFEHDMRVRSQLAATGALFQGYHPDMEAVHRANASELDQLLAGVWPLTADVGEDGQTAAWRLVQHAISLPEFQRRYLSAVKRAVAEGHAPGWQAAMLEDRIRFFEGRLQVYGTQFDWDDAGLMSPVPLEDPANVDARRAAVGMEPLAAATARRRETAAREGERRPADRALRDAEFAAWAVKVGWRV